MQRAALPPGARMRLNRRSFLQNHIFASASINTHLCWSPGVCGGRIADAGAGLQGPGGGRVGVVVGESSPRQQGHQLQRGPTGSCLRRNRTGHDGERVDLSPLIWPLCVFTVTRVSGCSVSSSWGPRLLRTSCRKVSRRPLPSSPWLILSSGFSLVTSRVRRVQSQAEGNTITRRLSQCSRSNLLPPLTQRRRSI